MLTRTRSPSLMRVSASIRSAVHSVDLDAFCSRSLALWLSPVCAGRKRQRVKPMTVSEGDADFRSSVDEAVDVVER